MRGTTIEIIDEDLPSQLQVGISTQLALMLVNWMLTSIVDGTVLGEDDDINNTMAWDEIDDFFAKNVSPDSCNVIHKDTDGREVTEEVFNALYLVALHVVTLIEDTVRMTTGEHHCFVLDECQVYGHGAIHFTIGNWYG